MSKSQPMDTRPKTVPVPGDDDLVFEVDDEEIDLNLPDWPDPAEANRASDTAVTLPARDTAASGARSVRADDLGPSDDVLDDDFDLPLPGPTSFRGGAAADSSLRSRGVCPSQRVGEGRRRRLRRTNSTSILISTSRLRRPRASHRRRPLPSVLPGNGLPPNPLRRHRQPRRPRPARQQRNPSRNTTSARRNAQPHRPSQRKLRVPPKRRTPRRPAGPKAPGHARPSRSRHRVIPRGAIARPAPARHRGHA